MILSCPACSTRYSVPEAALGAGRTVRCAQCAHSWRAAPDGAAPAQAPEAPAPAAEAAPHRAYRARVETRKRQRRRAAAMAGWGAVAASLAAGLSAAWMLRADVVRAIPRTASAYAFIGFEVNKYGLTIENLVSERIMDGGEPALSVRAELRNVDRKPRPAPLVRFDLRDADGEAFFAWTVAPEIAVAPPGGAIPVAAVLVNPPDRAVDVMMTLTDEAVVPDGADIEAPAPAGEDARVADAGARS